MFRVLTQALADDWPPTATVSEPIICDGGILTRPRLIELARTSLSFGRTWSVRMCGKTSDRISRSSTSLRSRFFTPFRLMLWAVWLSKFGSEKHTNHHTLIYTALHKTSHFQLAHNRQTLTDFPNSFIAGKTMHFPTKSVKYFTSLFQLIAHYHGGIFKTQSNYKCMH